MVPDVWPTRPWSRPTSWERLSAGLAALAGQDAGDVVVNRREIVTPDRRQILTPYSRCLKRQESFPVSMISQ